MSEEGETPIVEVETAPTPEVAVAPPEPLPEAQPETPPRAKPSPVPSWVPPRIDKLSAEKKEALARAEAAEREATELKAKLAALQQPDPGRSPAPLKGPDPALEIERRAQALAEQRAIQARFDENARKAVDLGQAKYKDFPDVVGNFRNVADLNTKEGSQFVESALDTEAPHEVLYHLGQNLDEFQRIFNLPPTRQAVALDALARQLVKPPATTKMPAPITPVGGRTTANPNALADAEGNAVGDIDTWMALRNKQVQATRKNGKIALH